MAKKKAAGAKASQKGNVAGKRRGVKIFGGEFIQHGAIILRQVGTKYLAGDNVGMGRDFTLFALKEGTVKFSKNRNNKTVANVI